MVSAYGNYVPKTEYKKFAATVRKLYAFISIFKSDLQDIEIDKKYEELMKDKAYIIGEVVDNHEGVELW